MNDLIYFLLIGLSLFTCAGIAFLSLKIFSFQASANVQPQDAEIFSQIGIPSSAAARHQMLNNDPDGVMFEKIKAAARMKYEKPVEFFGARWQRRAGITNEEAINAWREKVKKNLYVSFGAALLIGLFKGISAMAVLAPPLFLTGLAVTLIQLFRAGNERERIVNGALRSLVRELRALLVGENDVVTCLAMVTKGSNFLVESENPVRSALAQAVEKMRNGLAVDMALRDAARLIEMRNFSALCTYLIMVHSGSPEWKRQFDELTASLDDHDMLMKDERRREQKRRFL